MPASRSVPLAEFKRGGGDRIGRLVAPSAPLAGRPPPTPCPVTRTPLIYRREDDGIRYKTQQKKTRPTSFFAASRPSLPDLPFSRISSLTGAIAAFRHVSRRSDPDSPSVRRASTSMEKSGARWVWESICGCELGPDPPHATDPRTLMQRRGFKIGYIMS